MSGPENDPRGGAARADGDVQIRLAKVHHPVTALGPGTRAGIWFQGCTLACHGCLSTDTWPADAGRVLPVSAVLDWLAGLPPVDGVTISGGEPFQQPEALAALLRGIHVWRGSREFDILLYSGYVSSRLSRDPESRNILDLCDAVVAGPYVERLDDGSPLRGSANQTLVPLTALGRKRYEHEGHDVRRMQVCVEDGAEGRRVYYIGIPRRGDMDRLSAVLDGAGVRAGEASWRL
ncbi:4Fe-4S single cluster domain-containing protein [Actinocorallia sp. A-T 12471]|uniref:4Fe-4S single cluster domain-containing protein n=1 Tax=Actinocorallia sp. A-T 12471 TaxID=3089813 RepID=UPI0029D0BCF7|nr:4Fe-4S single cluster domain-containing protein [Actinocorallia sp. A-T 12471]MDX6738633.1 4Fe-4S single cluster domain-containing protein [Actinocorallia sp. A-T 12471]